MDILIPRSFEEALMLKNENRAWLSGGSEVLRLGSAQTGMDLIDINALLSSDISEESGFVIIGSRATFKNIMESGIAPSFLKEACSFLSSPELRNQATIGGNVASARDDSFLVPALVAAAAEVTLAKDDGGKETVDIESYLYSGEERIIIDIRIPKDAEVRVAREALTARSHAVVTGAFGAVDCWAIKGTGIVTNLDEAELKDDLWGSAAYKAYIARTMREA